MSETLRIDPSAPVIDELRRLAALDLDGAIAELGPLGTALPPDAVHDVRKRLKRLRALVRLGRGGALDGDLAREENAAYRDLGQLLAGRRDAEALVETVERLQDVAGDGDPDLRDQLVALRSEVEVAAAGAPADLADVDEARRGLREARARVDGWPTGDGQGWDLLRPGLLRQYGRGRDAFRATAHDPSDDEFHAWRKRVKDHWYQLQLLHDAWPKVLKATAKEAHDLADLLGDDHDLAVLADSVDLAPAVADLVAHERRHLQHRARHLGARLFAEPPKRLGHRLGGWWAAG